MICPPSDGFSLYREYLWYVDGICSIDDIYGDWAVSVFLKWILLVFLSMVILRVVGLLLLFPLLLFQFSVNIHCCSLLCSQKFNQ